MKKIFLALLVMTIGVNINAQEGTPVGGDTTEGQEKMARIMELMAQKIEMDVDTELFASVGNNTYVSESPKAVVMAMMVPDNYENSKKKMDKDTGQQFKVIEKGETEINGVKTLFMIGTSEAEGAVLDNMIYCIEVDADTCLMFIGMVDQKADPKYAEAITKTMNSVIKKK
jgi:hypothetical protein